MSEAMREWLEKELQDFEPVLKSFRAKQQRMYYLWMAGAVIGMVALGLGVGYDLAYVMRVHLLIGIGIAVFIWLFVLLSGRTCTIKAVRKQFEEALSALSPSDQAAFARQDFGRVDFLNTSEDSFPARLLMGPDYWLYFRGACRVFRVADMQSLQAREEDIPLHYKVGNTRVRQKVTAGVSLVVDYREEESDQVYLANWEQLQTAKGLLEQHCPKAKALWQEK